MLHTGVPSQVRLEGYQEPIRNYRQTKTRNRIQVDEVKTVTEEAEYSHAKISSKVRTVDLVNYYCPDDKSISLVTLKSQGQSDRDKRRKEVEALQDNHRSMIQQTPIPSILEDGAQPQHLTQPVHRTSLSLHKKRGFQTGESCLGPIVITIEGVQQENKD